MLLYDRVARVTIYRPAGDAFFATPGGNAIEIDFDGPTGFRIQFTIEKTLGSDPNTCDVVISNLSEETRGAIARTPLQVILHAGHDGILKRLAYGDLQWSDSMKRGADFETTMLVGDGDRAYRHARVNRSYKAGTKVVDILRDAARAMGLELPREVAVSRDLSAQVASGDTVVGPARDEMTRLLAAYGYGWSVQDGRLVILKDSQQSPGTAWLIDPNAGMVESPEAGRPEKGGKPPLWTVRTALYPEITPGGRVRLQSERVSGTFRVERVRHTGDTHGSDWTTEISCRPT